MSGSPTRPTLRQFEYLVALGEHLSFRKAADSCQVTQPGLSAQIKQLEETLGVALFERDRRKVLPTPAGEKILAAARDVLASVDDIVSTSASFGEPLTGELRLGVIPTIAPYLLPRVVAAARDRFPELRLLLTEDTTHNLVEAATAGRLDLLLLSLEADLGNLETLLLGRDRFFVAVPPGHPYAKRAALSLDDLEGQDILLLDEGHCLRDQILPLCEGSSGGRIADLRATSLTTLTQMVASGIGLTILPEMAREAESERLVAIDLDPAYSRTVGFAWRRTSRDASAYQTLADVFRDVSGLTAS